MRWSVTLAKPLVPRHGTTEHMATLHSQRAEGGLARKMGSPELTHTLSRCLAIQLLVINTTGGEQGRVGVGVGVKPSTACAV